MLKESSLWMNSPLYVGAIGLAIAAFFYFRVLALPQGN